MEKTERDDLAQAVYEIARLIPEGRATSYGAIARAIGRPELSRLVGYMMGACDTSVPAHRVVNSQGVLSACRSFGAGDGMERLLEAEGIVILNNRIRDWKQVFWDPVEEINMI